MAILTQFLFRLAFGLAVAMSITPARQVTSGFFRVHAYVLLGLTALAALVALGSDGRFLLWPPLTSALLSYLAAAFWLYERPRPGKLLLVAVAMVSLLGARLALPPSAGTPPAADAFPKSALLLAWLDPVAGGLLLGTTFAAMLLGHWYLNTPSMQLAPLQRLVKCMTAAALVRACVSGGGLALATAAAGPPDMAHALFLTLRWLAGIVGLLLVTGLTWQTLKIPNTQSATGILYVGVIASFLGELTAQLLSAESPFPL